MKTIDINTLPELDTLSNSNTRINSLVLHSSNNSSYAFKVDTISALENFLIPISKLTELENKLAKFKLDLDKILLTLVPNESLSTNRYMSRLDAARKLDELMTYEKLESLLKSNYITQNDLDLAIAQSTEHAYSTANSLYTSLVQSAATVRSGRATSNAINSIEITIPESTTTGS